MKINGMHLLTASVSLCLLMGCKGVTVTPTLLPSLPATTISVSQNAGPAQGTATHQPTWTPEPPEAVVRATVLMLPDGLSVEEYRITQPPEGETPLLYFEHGDPRYLHYDERFLVFPTMYCNSLGLTMCATLSNRCLTAEEVYSRDANDSNSGEVILRRDGEEIYTIDVGMGSPVTALQGLWVYDGHWALEAAYITETLQGNVTNLDVNGRIIIDGQVLNETHHYDDAFGFQTIHGRPFYFFERDGKIGAWYDNTEIPLGYDQIPHYGCCSSAVLNPERSQNMVTFFAIMNDDWYYVEIGVYGQE